MGREKDNFFVKNRAQLDFSSYNQPGIVQISHEALIAPVN